MYYKYITRGDLKQLTNEEIQKLTKENDAICFLFSEEKLKQEITKKTKIAYLYKTALESGKYILLIKDITEKEKITRTLVNYFNNTKTKPKRILIVK